MKIKTFKNLIKNEKYDIPDVLEKIKPYANNAEYHIEKRKSLFFKNLLQLVPVMTVFAICLVVLFNLEETSIKSEPKSYHEGEIAPEDIQPIIITQTNIFDSYLEKSKETYSASSIETSDFSGNDYINKECPSNNYCMWVISENDSTTLVVDDVVFNYLLTYINDNKGCTIIEAVDTTKKEFSIPDDETYAVCNAYNYIINNKALNK